jgi:glyoxylase-like metal-dependent hydrolase (beta-lactamase superfamily II)
MPKTPAIVAWAMVAALAPAAPSRPAPPLGAASPHLPAAPHAVARFQIGSFEVIALSDGTVPLDVHPLLKGAPAARLDALLSQSFESNPVETSINAFLVDTGSRVILVDAGAGELFGPHGGMLLHSLAAAGYRPADITDILLTHIHTDHSGGLARGGERLFRNATVHAGEADARFFLDRAGDGAAPETRHHEEAMATVEPYRRAGKLRLFSREAEILPGVTALPAPGHTPGHSVFRIDSRSDSLEFWGDLVHVAAVQLPRPEVTITFDVDRKAARRQRLRHFRAAAGERRLVAAAHLNFPGIGRLRPDGSGYRWVPAPHRLPR